MNNLMVDLETLGKTPGCVVLSIGAVAFDNSGLSQERFYEEININSSKTSGQLFTDQSTLDWWSKQSGEAKALLSRCGTGGLELDNALLKFSRFMFTECDKDLKIWGNGASFDEPILSEAYKSIGLTPPWKYFNSRCYRTLKAFGKGIVKESDFAGVKHNALDDAVHQAAHAVKIVNHFGIQL